jgi:hypothetical protein
MALLEGSSDGGSADAGTTDPGPSDGGAVAGTTTTTVATDGSSDAGSSDASSSDAGSTDAGSSDASTTTTSDASTPAAPTIDYTVMVAIPSSINDALSSADQATMLNALGNPGTPDPGCGPSSAALQKLMKTASVGPFRVTGLGPAVDALTRVFAAVQSAEPALYTLLGTQGMLCVRYVRGSTTNFSNHAWGTAIDMTIGGVLTPRGSATVSQGLLSLCPYMHAEQFFWGAGFSPTPDGMHYEASNELIAQWKTNGSIP